MRTSVCSCLVHPLLGIWLAIQACDLTGDRTGHPLVRRLVLNPQSYTSQGHVCFHIYLIGQKLFQLYLAEREGGMSLFQLPMWCPAKTRVLLIFPQFFYFIIFSLTRGPFFIAFRKRGRESKKHQCKREA